jgi:hypothetical protein
MEKAQALGAASQALGAASQNAAAEIAVARRVAFRPSALAASPPCVCVLACMRMRAYACVSTSIFELLRYLGLSLSQECLQNASKRPTSRF